MIIMAMSIEWKKLPVGARLLMGRGECELVQVRSEHRTTNARFAHMTDRPYCVQVWRGPQGDDSEIAWLDEYWDQACVPPGNLTPLVTALGGLNGLRAVGEALGI